MRKQTTRILWSASLGLGVVLGTSLAATYQSESPTSGGPSARRPATASSPAAVTFEDDSASAVGKPGVAGVPAVISMEDGWQASPAPRQPQLQSPFALTGKATEGVPAPSPYSTSSGEVKRIVVPTLARPAASPGGEAPKGSLGTQPPAEPGKPIAPKEAAAPKYVVQVHVPPHTTAATVEFAPAPATEKAAEQLIAPPHAVPKIQASPMASPAKAPSRTRIISLEIPPHAVEQHPELPAGPGMTGAIGEMVAPPTTDPGWNGPAEVLFGEAPMLGRGDQNNRFNLFNEQSALVQSHLWFGYHHQFDYNPALQLTGAASAKLAASHQTLFEFLGPQAIAPQIMDKTDQDLYRVGFEYGFNPAWSFIFQAQYVSEVGPGGVDGWSSPFFAVKRVIYQQDRAVVSVVLGVEPQTEVKRGEYKEDATRWYPGILWYEELGANWVVQGGLQLGLPFGSRPQPSFGTHDRPHTLDYDISVGYWLYRCPDLLAGVPEHGGWRPFVWNDGPFIYGALMQIELLGKHVLAGATMDTPFRLTNLADNNGAGLNAAPLFEYIEPRNVLDVTVGGRLLLRHQSAVSVAVSAPITGAHTRAAELMVYLSCDY